MEGAADKIFPTIKTDMAYLAYGDAKSIINEWFVRLCVLMHDRETGASQEDLSDLVFYNMAKGFLLMERGYGFMDHFYANRDKYPTIHEFMPQLVGFLNYNADEFEFIVKEHRQSPYITNIYPTPGSDISNEQEMVITFSEPMHYQYNIELEEEAEYLNLMTYEELFDTTLHKWSDDGRVYTYKLPTHRLKPGSKYRVILNLGFVCRRMISMRNKEIIYTTAEK